MIAAWAVTGTRATQLTARCAAFRLQVMKFWAVERRDIVTNEIVEGAFTGEVSARQ